MKERIIVRDRLCSYDSFIIRPQKACWVSSANFPPKHVVVAGSVKGDLLMTLELQIANVNIHGRD